ncbi:copper chaperone PCu(A)C [Leptothrix ochracea]|uniref:copper chaperone PCu(A)C n=2 Tax=Leptothrix ochracea TaxID=735331 RepID=UPI0034E1F14D
MGRSAAILFRYLSTAVGACLLGLAAHAHDFKAGDITIDHPYTPPTVAEQKTGAVYFRHLSNGGDKADRLISASTPVARAVEIHHMAMDGDVMRMRAIPALDLPAGQSLELKQGGPVHVMLLDLKQPLKDGARFPLVLRFERGGEKEVMVWVQTPRRRGDEGAAHVH